MDNQKNLPSKIKLVELGQNDFDNAIEKQWLEIKRRENTKTRAYELEAIRYLREEQGIENPKELLSQLFKTYQVLDPYADYISVAEREYFPHNLKDRTIARFLRAFKPLFSILQKAQQRIVLQQTFDAFWQKCIAYLEKREYPRDFLDFICDPQCPFKESSFYHWRKFGSDDPKYLDQMLVWFRACFGVSGIEELCQVPPNSGEWNWSWQKMKRCYEEFTFGE